MWALVPHDTGKEKMMERIGLTVDEFVDLKIKPRASADRAFHEAAEIEREQMSPMTLAAASSHLRSRGYDCRPAMLELLVKDGVVTPTEADAWAQADVDAAAEHFEDCGILTPYAAMCQTLGCRYADFLRPLREAAERESRKYGRPVPDDRGAGEGHAARRGGHRPGHGPLRFCAARGRSSARFKLGHAA
jgi:hypothetical protein